jgi:hydroxylaminobenzene mutase
VADLLIKLGVALFFLGLVSGVLIPAVKNPRMGLTSHLEGTQNGMMLIFLGL